MRRRPLPPADAASRARAPAIRRRYPVPARTCRAIEGKASKQAKQQHASRQAKIQTRGELAKRSVESTRERAQRAQRTATSTLVHTKHRLAAAVASRAELVSSETRHTGANHFSLPTFILVHDTTTRAVTHGARVGSPRDTACFEFRVGGFSLQTEVRSTTQAMLRYTRLYVEYRFTPRGRALSMARCILRFLFLPY